MFNALRVFKIQRMGQDLAKNVHPNVLHAQVEFASLASQASLSMAPFYAKDAIKLASNVLRHLSIVQNVLHQHHYLVLSVFYVITLHVLLVFLS